jgi:sec-independent protein translocase protein TatA
MGPQVWIVLAVIVLVFGSSQLPKLARSLTEAQRELRKGMSDGEAGDDRV